MFRVPGIVLVLLLVPLVFSSARAEDLDLSQSERTCREDKDCGDGGRCWKQDGDCNGIGKCQQRSSVVIMIRWDSPPWCGCDGETYRLIRSVVSVNKAHDGPCPRKGIWDWLSSFFK